MENSSEKLEEFEPFEHISRTVTLWWVIVLCAVLGGAAGFVVHRFKPPLYEAKAVFMTSIDFNKLDFMNLPKTNHVPYQFTQYDEDVSLVVMQVALLQVKPQVLAYAQANGWPIDAATLDGLSTIERKHAIWELRFRYSDPALAQKLVNYWAQTGFADLQAKQKANQLPPYIFFDLIQLAELPKSPTYFQTNSLVLAGIVIGLVTGIFFVNMPFINPRKNY